MSRPTLATVWLDGCSGCHMSFLDLDEALVDLASRVNLVYSPLVDTKAFPTWVDVALVEGAISTDEDVEKIRRVRASTRVLVALGDCAVTGNVPAMRSSFPVASVLARAYVETASRSSGVPNAGLPVLLQRVRPVHEVVPVDLVVPGCPPPPAAIGFLLDEILAGRTPDVGELTRFGR